MNIELLSTFQQNYPEEFDGTLDCASMAVCCAFNKVGSLLAVGCSDGRLVIWDFLTRGIAKIISADWSPICSLSWSKKSDLIATSSTDNTVCIWSTSTGRCRTRISCIQSPILKVQYHPRNSSFLLICPLKHSPVLIDDNGQYQIVSMDEESNEIVATFDRKGAHIILGNSRGLVVIKTFPKLETVSSFRISTGTNTNTMLKHIEISRRGPYCLINTSDRIIRIYNYHEMLNCGLMGEIEPKQKLQDLVNKTLWRKCTWSGDGEYICGASSRQHTLCIWETASGAIARILQGTKGETLADVCWHPVRPIIASISNGIVSIWSHSQVENWSAFAPDFRELEENVEYHERESEFDVTDEDRSVDQTPTKVSRVDTNGNPIDAIDDDEIDIDVVTEPRIEALVSSDDEDINDHLIYLPSAPEIEDPDIDSSSMKPTSASPSLQTPIQADQTFDIQLPISPVQDPHPYFAGAKQTRPTANGSIATPVEVNASKRDNKQRRKGSSNTPLSVFEGPIQEAIISPQSFDSAISTLKRSFPTPNSEMKASRARSARIEGKKAANVNPPATIPTPTTPTANTLTIDESSGTVRTKRQLSDVDTDFIPR